VKNSTANNRCKVIIKWAITSFDGNFCTVYVRNTNFHCFKVYIGGQHTRFTSVKVYSSNFSKHSDISVNLIGDKTKSVISVNRTTFYESHLNINIMNTETSGISILNSKFVHANVALDIGISGKNGEVNVTDVEFKENNQCLKMYFAVKYLSVNIFKMHMQLNSYNGQQGIIFINSTVERRFMCSFEQCKLSNNTSKHGAVVYIAADNDQHVSAPATEINISTCTFDHNYGRSSILHVAGPVQHSNILGLLALKSSNFTNNTGSASVVSSFWLTLYSPIVFKNNHAENGAAIYLNGCSKLTCTRHSTKRIEFINNIATYHGGAIYFNFSNNNSCGSYTLHNDSISFINNSAGISGNTMYLKSSNFEVHSDLLSSILKQPSSTVATSPNTICNVTCNGQQVDNHKSCGRRMLGESVAVSIKLCDYYGNRITEQKQYNVSCLNCGTKYKLILNEESPICETVEFVIAALNATEISHNYNDTLHFSITVESKLLTTVSVDMSPCLAGFVFNEHSQMCTCYNSGHSDILSCIISKNSLACRYADPDGNQCSYNHDTGGDDFFKTCQCPGIRQGYWFGNVSGKYTVSLYPNDYCDFKHRKEIENRYYGFSSALNEQCNPNRTGIACGDCILGYTLAYNTPNCINSNNCSLGMFVLVAILTVLYWIAVVTVLSGLMHSKFQMSLGHMYGIIYYYSIVDVLMGNYLYTTDGIFHLVAVISSFAKLIPQFIGKFCFIEGLSGIDQQFLNYIHAIGVSILLFGISKAAKYSRRVANYGKYFIVRAVCILLLLSYTSLASTSIQLLRPLRFYGVDDIYCYSTPSMEYFRGKHIAYGITAILCIAVFVLAFPCLLLLEPVLNRKFNLIRAKPLLDQFQGCYKDKYRWFAAYYLICRLVIFTIAYTTANYRNRLYYLQTTCVVIAMIHGWVQPYKHGLLNISDSTILLNMVLVVNLTTFRFPKHKIIGIAVILVIFPLFILFVAMAKILLTPWILNKLRKHNQLRKHRESQSISDEETQPLMRYAHVLHMYVICVIVCTI